MTTLICFTHGFFRAMSGPLLSCWQFWMMFLVPPSGHAINRAKWCKMKVMFCFEVLLREFKNEPAENFSRCVLIHVWCTWLLLPLWIMVGHETFPTVSQVTVILDDGPIASNHHPLWFWWWQGAKCIWILRMWLQIFQIHRSYLSTYFK